MAFSMKLHAIHGVLDIDHEESSKPLACFKKLLFEDFEQHARNKMDTIDCNDKVARAPEGIELLNLGHELVAGTMVRRPSARNKSPWVADVMLDDGKIALVHVPAMDMGGKCEAGAKVLMKASSDKMGHPVGAGVLGEFGTPKCEFIIQLVRVDEPENEHLGGCWVCAHPRLGELLAEALLQRGLIPGLTKPKTIYREVNGVAGCNMRADFVLESSDHVATVIEVKSVLDTDYSAATAPARKKCVFVGATNPYRRAAIFPWGVKAQRGPDGEKVVSARAIKHIDELTAIARGDKHDTRWNTTQAAILFMVLRHDAETFKANWEACECFARHLQAAEDAGVQVLAHRIRWGDGADVGKAFSDGPLQVDSVRAHINQSWQSANSNKKRRTDIQKT